jgi:hypothetical protein
VLDGAMRMMLYVAAALVVTIGITLNLLTERTADLFAWPVNPPLTAAFLGAGYWAAGAIELLAARERLWASARVAVPAVLVFTALTFVLTVVHIDRFNLAHPDALTVVGTWTWVAVYASVPIILAALLIRQWRASTGEPPRLHPLPGWYGIALVAGAILLISMGVWLFVAPTEAAGLWPWTLTALTGRAVGAWLIGVGIVLAHARLEDDWDRLRPATVSLTLLGILEMVALARFGDVIDWERPNGWVYAAFLVVLTLIGAYGIPASFRARAPRAG